MTRLRWYFTLCVAFVLIGSGVLTRSAVAAPRRGQDEPILITEAHISAYSGTQATLMVHVFDSERHPLIGVTVMLLSENARLELYTRTDEHGAGIFRLPPSLGAGDHDLWVVFPGSEEISSVTAHTTLHISTERGPQQLPTALIEATPPQPPTTADQAMSLQLLVSMFQTLFRSRPALAEAPPARPERYQTPPTLGREDVKSDALQVPQFTATVLSVTPETRTAPGQAARINAQLSTKQGAPVVGADLVLSAASGLELHAHTAVDGSITFRLPGDLAEGDYPIAVLYAGNDKLAPAIASATLHYHAASPGTNEQPAADPVTASSESTSRAPQTAVSAAPQSERVERTVDAAPVGTFARPATTPAPGLVHLMIQENVPRVVGLLKVGTMLGVATLDQIQILARTGAALALTTFPPLQPLGQDGVLWVVGLLALGLVMTPALARGRLTLPMPRWSVSLPRLPQIELPMPVWYGVRIVSVGIALGMAVVLVARPQQGLFIFWRVFIPMVPLLFFLAPGLWRNICPMAALNQTPRLFHFSRTLTAPRWMQRYGFLVAISLFVILVSSRKVIFNSNGPALAILILCALAAAFVMGNFFKGKSGWCSSICPLLPVQRIYGQTPFVPFSHAHCQPCLGCTKNCYDLSPNNAYLADLYDEDRQFAGMRKAFMGFFPGFVLAFYLTPNPPAITIWQVYASLIGAGLVSLMTFLLVEAALRAASNKITVVYGAVALNGYYWFNSLMLGSLINSTPPQWFVWSLRSLVCGLTLLWIYRTYRKETAYVQFNLTSSSVIELDMPITTTTRTANRGDNGDGKDATPAEPMVTVEPEGVQFAVPKNRTLLEAIESQGLPIETGCRMGLCGADPVCVKAGMQHLSKPGAEECKTLERLGLAPNTRMACMARVRGPVTVALAPERPDVYRSSIVAGFKHDVTVKKVVIVGNGIAGVTAADHIRRRHPHCEIHLIGREPHHLYNRMGITRLIYGRSAMQGLYLLPEQWYDDFNITCWLNTKVTEIDAVQRQVVLGTGERLDYDRLILATGSRSFVPAIKRFGLTGTYVLRSAEDAMSIRSYVQEEECRSAVVAGGGLLGIEAAYGLSKMGLDVTVIERGSTLLSRQLDARSAEFLVDFLESIGIHVIKEAEVAAVNREDSDSRRVEEVTLKDGRTLACDLLLVSAGIRSDVSLARNCGLKINRGVIVDAEMRTSDPHIFAAGDVAEFEERISGLWPVAVSQAEVAAANAVAEPDAVGAIYVDTPPSTMLKVAGIDVTSIGRIHAEPHEEEIVLEESAEHRYRKLILDNGVIVGAILLGYPEEASGVTEAAKQRIDMAPHLAALRRGDWETLRDLA